MRPLTVAEAQKRYGVITNGKWADEAKWMVVFQIPTEFKSLINSANGKQATKIYCNKDLVPILSQAFTNIKNNKLVEELKTFDGCFMIRDVRGVAGSPSTHSYGLAIDINAKENQLGQTPKLSSALVKCFTDAGFSWGGNFKRKDGMHFSYAWE